MVLDVLGGDPATQITGLSVIVDFQGFGWKQLSNVGLDLARVIVKTIQDTVPMRVKGMF